MSSRADAAHIPLAKVLGITAAAALVPLNSTMIAVALPSIADAFDISTARVSLLVTLYLVCMLVGQPIAGRVGDLVGSARTMRVALAGLALFSGVAALATVFWLVVLARVLQAMCAAALSPGAQSLLRAAAPPAAQGRVFGIFGSVLGAGAAAGPVVGGLLIAVADWRAIFVVNIPIALAAMIATRSIDAPDPVRRSKEAGPPGRVVNPVFVASFSVQALSTQGQYALLLLTPIMLDARGWGAGSIGLALSALTVGMIVAGPPGGRFGDQIGRRLPAVAGLALAGLAIGLLAVAGPTVDPIVLVVGMALFGLGLGVATPNVMSAALGSVPEARTGSAAGMFSTSRYVGSISTTLLIAAWVTDDAVGTTKVLTTSVACMALAVGAAQFLPGGDAWPATRRSAAAWYSRTLARRPQS